jgi:hypothetical protein
MRPLRRRNRRGEQLTVVVITNDCLGPLSFTSGEPGTVDELWEVQVQARQLPYCPY